MKLRRRPKLTAHQQRETIKRHDAGEPVREIALLPLMADHLRHHVFRRDRAHHRHMIADAMAFLDLAFLRRRKFAEHLSKMPSRLPG